MSKLLFKMLQTAALFMSVAISSQSLALVPIQTGDVCDNLQLNIKNQLTSRYELEISNIAYKKGQSDNILHAGSTATYQGNLTETMHPGMTLWGLLHGTIESNILVNVIENDNDKRSVVNKFELRISAHGAGKLKGLCVIETNVDIHEIALPTGRGLLTVERQGQNSVPPEVTVNVWALKN